MPRHYRRLTELQVRNAKWSGRTTTSGKPLPDTLTDGEGLTLTVHPRSKVWVLRLFIRGKERRSGLGTYREDGRGVSLKQARDKAEGLRVQARTTGETQADTRRAEREEAERAIAAAVRVKQAIFETVARDWHRITSPMQTLKHSKQCIATLEQHVFPVIGKRDMNTLTPNEILKTVIHPMLFDRVDKAGKPLPPLIETATRVTMRIGGVFEHANLQDICGNNPYPACKRQFNRWKRQLLKAFPETNYPALQRPEDVGAMLRAVATVPGDQTRLAIEAISYMAVRSGELRGSTWAEFDLEGDKPMWTIPAARMKARREHQVPLSHQAVTRLRALRQLARGSARVLPGRIDPTKSISDMTLSMAFRRIGYEGVQTVHGLRAIFSTLMREQSKFRPQAIEVQLAHSVKDPTEAAYNRAMYLDERCEMMQFYADLLDGLRDATELG